MPSPTHEQLAIIAAAKETQENLLVNALAGTGKTTTIEMVCHAITSIPILYLAFNRRIVDEAAKRMPSHVECRTQNSLGHRVWAQATGRRLVVDGGKMRQILKNIISDLPRKNQGEAWEDFSDTLRWISRAKRDGYVPPDWHERCHPIISDWQDFIDSQDDIEPTRQQRALIERALHFSILAAHEGGIDFDDQIYMPVIFGGPWPKFPLVIVDEVQDQSPLNHEMMKKLVTKRFMGVGDPCQSIYAFRGAVTNGMGALSEHFNCVELPLSLTFRVPRRGVERARTRVPSFEAYHTNPEGKILELNEWGPDDVPASAAIICRNNAPLLSLGFKLLAARRSIKLVGMDIGAGLVRILRKLGPSDLKGEELERVINRWMQEAIAKARNPATVYDRADCIHILTRGWSNLGEAIIQAEALFKQEGPIHLLSIHKSKGLEWDWVLHLDPWRVPSKFAKEGTEAWEQELNCRYVAETRFKQTLVLANLEGWNHE
jgi:DNA helicase II / ATP-dependent DNA helicase PcrA